MVIGVESYFSEVYLVGGKTQEEDMCRKSVYKIERPEWKITIINQKYWIESRIMTTINEIYALMIYYLYIKILLLITVSELFFNSNYLRDVRRHILNNLTYLTKYYIGLHYFSKSIRMPIFYDFSLIFFFC